MHVTFRFPHLAGVLLLLAGPFASAESPMPDPIAPAVIGRPLDRIRPARPLAQKPAAAKPGQRKLVAAGNKAAHPPRPAPVAMARAPLAVARAPVAAAPAPVAVARAAVPEAPALQQVPSRVPGPGAYFSSKDHALVRGYYDAHPAAGQAQWKIGEPIPPKSALTGVPDNLRAALSALPRGHQYVQVDGEVVLVAVPSRVVVDGISRGMR